MLRVRHVKVQGHLIDLRTLSFGSIWPVESDGAVEIPSLTEIGCAGRYSYFSTDDLKLWSCKISEISQSNLNINLIKQLTEKSKFNKIRKSMNSAQKSPNPNSQRQRLKVKWPRLTSIHPIFTQVLLISPHLTSFCPNFTSFHPNSTRFHLIF